jgi:hypothetical protein
MKKTTRGVGDAATLRKKETAHRGLHLYVATSFFLPASPRLPFILHPSSFILAFVLSASLR